MATRKITGTWDDETLIVRSKAREIRERCLIDVQDDCQLTSAVHPRLQIGSRLVSDGGDVGLVATRVDVCVDLTLCLDEAGRGHNRRSGRRSCLSAPRTEEDERWDYRPERSLSVSHSLRGLWYRHHSSQKQKAARRRRRHGAGQRGLTTSARRTPAPRCRARR